MKSKQEKIKVVFEDIEIIEVINEDFEYDLLVSAPKFDQEIKKAD